MNSCKCVKLFFYSQYILSVSAFSFCSTALSLLLIHIFLFNTRPALLIKFNMKVVLQLFCDYAEYDSNSTGLLFLTRTSWTDFFSFKRAAYFQENLFGVLNATLLGVCTFSVCYVEWGSQLKFNDWRLQIQCVILNFMLQRHRGQHFMSTTYCIHTTKLASYTFF